MLPALCTKHLISIKNLRRSNHGHPAMRFIGPLWGIAGVCLLIGSAIYRLSSHAIEALQRNDLSVLHWVTLIGFTLFMLFTEGYRGFQKKFSPRTAARVRYLRDNPKLLHVLLAPLFCMGYFHATRKTRITVIILTSGIICLILLVRLCPQPWRGIIDVGVIAGLTYGTISFLLFCIKALTQKAFPHSPEVPLQSDS